MRIAIEAQRLMRKRKHGMDIVVLELIRCLQMIDKENEYFIFTKSGDDEDCIQETDNFKIIITKNQIYPIWEQFLLPRYCKKYKIDLLHCTSNTAPLNIKVPLVLTLHDIIFMSDDDTVWKGGSYYQKIGNLYRRYLVPKLIPKCKRIITVSNFAKKEIHEFFDIADHRLVKIYNGINREFKTTRTAEELLEVKESYQLPDKYLFFLGNTAPKKNLSGVLQAYAHYTTPSIRKEFPLVITDLTEEFLNQELKSLNASDVRENIHLVGYVDQRKLISFYTMANAFLYPSLAESFGLPMIEAMACKTPVITSNNTSMPEVSGGCALYVDPFNPKEIGEAIVNLLSDTSLHAKLVQCGLERSKDFSFEKMTEFVHQIYLELSGKKLIKK